MHTADQLLLRARRLLTDGLVHDERAIRWAESVTGRPPRLQIKPGRRSRFTLRELSLGAEPLSRELA